MTHESEINCSISKIEHRVWGGSLIATVTVLPTDEDDPDEVSFGVDVAEFVKHLEVESNPYTEILIDKTEPKKRFVLRTVDFVGGLESAGVLAELENAGESVNTDAPDGIDDDDIPF